MLLRFGKTAEYDREVERLIEVVGLLAASLVDEAPSERSLEVYRPHAAVLQSIHDRLTAARQQNATRAQFNEIARDLRGALSAVGAWSSKGEVPIARPDLLEAAGQLSIMFRLARYARIR